MNPTVFHLTTFLQGGAGRVLTDLALAQRRRGNRVVVIADDSLCPGYETYPAYRKELSLGGIPLIEICTTFRRELPGNIAAALRVRNLLSDDSQQTLIHAHAAIPALIGLIARSGLSDRVPVLMTMQGWGVNKTPEQAATDVGIMNLIDEIVPVSQTSARLLREIGVANPNLEVVYNAVPDAFPSPAVIPDDPIWSRIELWRSKGVPIMGCIGTIGKRKNQACLLRALAQMTPRRAACVLIGEEDEPGATDLLIAELGLQEDVLLAGYRDDASALSRSFTCMVLPSRGEGLPLAVLEAFRDRIPVIGSDIPEIRELIEDDVHGRLFRDNDPAHLSVVLGDFLKSPAARTAWTDAAYRRYRESFTFSAMDRHYQNLYRTLWAC